MIEKVKEEVKKTFRQMFKKDYKILCGVLKTKNLPKQDDQRNEYSFIASAIYNAYMMPQEKIIPSDNKLERLLSHNLRTIDNLADSLSAKELREMSYAFYIASKQIESLTDYKDILLAVYECGQQARALPKSKFFMVNEAINNSAKLKSNCTVLVPQKDYSREHKEAKGYVLGKIYEIYKNLQKFNISYKEKRIVIKALDEGFYMSNYVYYNKNILQQITEGKYNFSINDLRGHYLKYSIFNDNLKYFDKSHNLKELKEFAYCAGIVAREKVFKLYKKYPEYFSSLAKSTINVQKDN